MILDPKREITRLIVMHNYLRLYCSSNKHVLNELRQKYWILKALATVHKISSSCPSCRRLRAKPEPLVMADLPDSRLGYQQPPFANTEVDYFGPILACAPWKEKRKALRCAFYVLDYAGGTPGNSSLVRH